MRYSFVASLNNLRFDRPIGNSWNITDDLKITNSKSVANRLVTDLFREEAGNLEARAILAGKPLLYVDSEYPLDDTSPEAQLYLLNHYLRVTQGFLCWMWLIKDNSINFDLGFLQYPFRNPSATGGRISSNGRTVWFSKSDGTLADTTFTTGELKDAIASFGSYVDLESIETSMGTNLTGPTRDDSRQTRAFYFLQVARGAGFLPQKIAYYCTCFETLVSTSASELAHQVAERVVILLAKDTSEASTIYKNMKSAYDTRSKLNSS